MEHAHQHRGDSADGEQQHGDVHANPGSHALRDIGRTTHSLEEDEVSQSGEGDAAKERHSHQAATGLTEGEHQASYPLHSHTEDEGYSHRHEDGKDNAQRLVCIEQIIDLQTAVAHHLDSGEDGSGSQELEYQRHGGRGGHAERVEHVEHDHIGHHHRQKNHHHLAHGIVVGHHDAMACHIHHARRHHGA